MAVYIEPRVLKGFRDFLPSMEITRRDLMDTIERSFRSYGFVPIDTPVLEYTEILLGKGGGETEKQVFRFLDKGGRDVALRFDLTVPLARFIAEHRQDLPIPFKCYHIAKVWRGENPQRGRYREFVQCDFDIVGSTSAATDFEILLVMQNTLNLICPGGSTIHFNHRGLFNRFLSRLDVMDKSVDILRIVDKLPKIGRDEVLKQLSLSIGNKAIDVLDYIEIKGTFDEKLRFMKEAACADKNCPESDRLSLIHRFIMETGTETSFVLDPFITRGLDYYTGIVFESFLKDLPEIGSVCSGGRYDNLVGLYTKPGSGEALGGVGSSIGIDRLIAALETLEKIKVNATYAKVGIACLSEKDSGHCQALAGRLRDKGIPCDVFLDEDKITKQYILAEKKGLSWLIIPDERFDERFNENFNGHFNLRDLSKRENQEFNTDELIIFLKEKTV